MSKRSMVPLEYSICLCLVASGIVILRCTKATATISAGITVNGISAAGSVSGDTTNMPAGEYFYSATSGTGTITFS